MIFILITISGYAFLWGNMNWHKYGKPELMWIPQAFFMFFMLHLVCETVKKNNKWKWLFYPLQFLALLSVGNIVKQITYKPGSQTWDYIWGAIAATGYIIFILIKNKKWVTRKFNRQKRQS